MYEAMRLVLAGVVKDFIDDGATRSECIFRKEDFDLLDDPIDMPEGKQVRVIFEYIPEDGPRG